MAGYKVTENPLTTEHHRERRTRESGRTLKTKDSWALDGLEAAQTPSRVRFVRPPVCRGLFVYASGNGEDMNAKRVGTCHEEGCEEVLWYGGRGRKPRYCPKHQTGTAANRRSKNTDKPQCCKDADGRNLKCPQHKEAPVAWRTKNHWEDYAGEQPRIVYGTQPIMPDREALDNAKTVEEEFATFAASLGYKEIAESGIALKGEKAAEMPPMGQWLRECYGDGSGPIPVIGQWNLDAYWSPVNASWRAEFGESAYVKPRGKGRMGLLPRGPEWPWAVEVARKAEGRRAA